MTTFTLQNKVHKMKKWLLLLCFTGSCFAGEPSEQRQAELRTLVKNDCSACHGLTLQGGMGPSLKPESLEGKPDELLIATILNGRKGTAMPSWKSMMSQDDITWLVGMLKSGK
jgi:cytochrome c55X